MNWIWALLSGIIMFLFGMMLMGEHLEQMSGGRAEKILRGLTSSRCRGALLGFLVTAIIQSSSATTVLAVSLADASILNLSQAVPLIIGSNVGTTITSWLLCLNTQLPHTGGAFTVIFALFGLLIYLLFPKRRAWGGVLLGLFLLLTGMVQMSEAAAPLTETAAFHRLVELASNPVLGILIGTIVTAILQSSSAAIGLVQAFSTTGSVTWCVGVPLVLGGNIGTCVTVLLAAIGGGPNAKRAAWAHLQFNLLGTVALLPLWLLLGKSLMLQPIDEVGIAMVHTSFNIISAILLLPMSNRLTGFFLTPSHKEKTRLLR